MSKTSKPITRRTLLGAAGGLAVGAGAYGIDATTGGRAPSNVAFYGAHQAGIATPRQDHTQFATFDLVTTERSELASLLSTWTRTAADLAGGRPAGAVYPSDSARPLDGGEAAGLAPGGLTIHVGFGPSLFGVGGADRFGLRHRAPAHLVDLPPFPGDALSEATTGGDLAVQVCSDDAQIAFHALRQLARAARGVAVIRWSQAGFNSSPAGGGTARNLLGFKDGTVNPASDLELADVVWASDEGPDWMEGGTYAVVRRIRVDLEAWDGLTLGQQQDTIGRYKQSGAPLGQHGEFDQLDLVSVGLDGRPLIPADAHVRQASAVENWGAQMLRRSYEYDNGFVASGGSAVADAGLLFCCYQRDPGAAFTPIFNRLARNDALMRFTTHTASSVYAIPGGAADSRDWIGRKLFED